MRKINPQVFFLVLGCIFGIIFCVFIPSGAGFDEDAHTVRILNIALGHIEPNGPDGQGFLTFPEIFSISYQRRFFQSPAFYQFSPEVFNLKPDRSKMINMDTRSNYFPFLYLPQVITAWVGWRIFDFPILPVIIAMRLAGMAVYLLAGAITIRLLPIGKWVFTILALSPLALFQASTLNGDGFTMAVSFLFIGLILNTYDKREANLTVNKALLIAGATILLGMAKPGTVILLPLLILLYWKRVDSRKPFFIIFTGVILSLLISFSWAYIVVLPTRVGSTDSSRLDQVLLVLRNLLDFIRGYLIGVFKLIPKYYLDWVASYGYWVGKVPTSVFWLFPISLLIAFFTEARNPVFTLRPRLVMFLSALFSLVAIASVKFVFGYIPGVIYNNAQARYFLPFAPLLFLSFAGWVDIKPEMRRFSIFTSAALIIATLILYSYGLHRTYYTECVYPVDVNHPCRLPQYKNLNVTDPPLVNLTTGLTISQTFSPHCSRISAVRILPYSAEPNGTGYLKMVLVGPNGQVTALSEVPVSQVTENKVVRFTFPPQEVVPFGDYSFRIVLSDGTGTVGRLAFLARKEDFYDEGKLTLNGNLYPAAADLYFQYECPPRTVQQTGR